MGTAAGDGREEKREGAEYRAEPIPEEIWRWLEARLGVETPDTAVREVLGEAVGWLAAAPVTTGCLPWSAAEVRDCAHLMATTVPRAVRLGWQVRIPSGKETLLERWLARWQLSHDATTAVAPFPLLSGAELPLLGERCARVAESYTDP